jgi:hypothetical protein
MTVGFVLVAGVISSITVVPVVAQAVKAALIRNVDEPARNFYSTAQDAGSDCSTNCVQQINFPTVPAGSRLHIKNISVRSLLKVGGKMYAAELFACPSSIGCATPPFGTPIIYIPMTLQATAGVVDTVGATPVSDVWVSNQPVDFYVQPGSFPEVLLTTDFENNNTNATIDGYTVSLP